MVPLAIIKVAEALADAVACQLLRLGAVAALFTVLNTFLSGPRESSMMSIPDGIVLIIQSWPV